MSRRFFLVVVAGLIGLANGKAASAADFERGDTREVPVIVRVQAPKIYPYRDNAHSGDGHGCDLHPGEVVEFIGVDQKFGALVRMYGPIWNDAASCRSGTLAFIAPEIIEKWPFPGKKPGEAPDENDLAAQAAQRILAQHKADAVQE